MVALFRVAFDAIKCVIVQDTISWLLSCETNYQSTHAAFTVGQVYAHGRMLVVCAPCSKEYWVTKTPGSVHSFQHQISPGLSV